MHSSPARTSRVCMHSRLSKLENIRSQPQNDENRRRAPSGTRRDAQRRAQIGASSPTPSRRKREPTHVSSSQGNTKTHNGTMCILKSSRNMRLCSCTRLPAQTAAKRARGMRGARGKTTQTNCVQLSLTSVPTCTYVICCMHMCNDIRYSKLRRTRKRQGGHPSPL